MNIIVVTVLLCTFVSLKGMNSELDKETQSKLNTQLFDATKNWREDDANENEDLEKRIKKLLKSGAQVDAYNDDNVTPLMLAAFDGIPTLAEFLLKKNANYTLEAGDNTSFQYTAGSTALHFAAAGETKNHYEVVKSLCSKAQTDEYDMTQFINVFNSLSESPLTCAAQCANSKTVKYLLENGGGPAAYIDWVKWCTMLQIAQDPHVAEIAQHLIKAQAINFKV